MNKKREKSYQETADKLVILLLERIIRKDIGYFKTRVNELLEAVNTNAEEIHVCASLLPKTTYNEIATVVYDTHPEIVDDSDLDVYLMDMLLAVTSAVVVDLAKQPETS